MCVTVKRVPGRSLPSCRLFCRWLMMAARMVATFITWAHCARPRANSSFQQAFIRLMLLSWLIERSRECVQLKQGTHGLRGRSSICIITPEREMEEPQPCFHRHSIFKSRLISSKIQDLQEQEKKEIFDCYPNISSPFPYKKYCRSLISAER